MLTRVGVRGTCVVFACFAVLFLAAGAHAQPRASSDLLLPYFEAGVSQGDATTVLVVSNTLNKPVDVLATVQTGWGIAVLPITLKLKAGELLTIDLRDWLVTGNLPDRRLSAADLLHLQAALTGKPSPRDGLYYSAETASGRAVGALTLRTLGDRPDALRGQYFQVEPGQGTSRTLDLADVDGPSVLCNRHTVRHLGGRPLAGTQVVLWTQPAGEPLPAPTVQDRRLSVAVSVFSPAGALVKQHTLRLLPVARVSLADLGLAKLLGRVEIATGNNNSAVAVYPAGSATFEKACVQAPANQPKIQITTLVNGQDANTQPGASIPVGAAVTWTYQVRNAGVGTLSKIAVTDDAAGTVKCPQKSLKPGQSLSCTRKGLAEACLHRNVGQVRAATDKRGTVTAQDPAYYTGDDGSALEIEVATNGLDADDPVGPRVPAGSQVDWSYRVQNTGTVRLFQISVKDDHGVVVDCPRVSLGPGEPMTCVASGTAVPGQYRNVATVTATAACGKLTASDVSHYFGESDAGLQLRALTNGYDADFPPGPSISVGSPVTWEYVVTNSGKLAVTGLDVKDDRNLSIACADTVIQPGSSVTCIARGVTQACQYSNFATASGLTSQGQVSASNASHYFGQSQAAVQVESLVNGDDADLPPGPSIPVGSSVQWSYLVTNLGTVTLSGVSVKDDRGVAVTCPKTVLQPGEAMTCSGTGAAVAGDSRSLATATAQPPCGSAVSDDDAGHYRGTGDPGIRIQKLTNGQDVSAPPGPSVAVGSVVSWTYIVTNTGRFPLSGIAVTDSRGVAVTCPRSDLPLGESMTCTGRGTAQACQYDNLATVTARTSGGQHEVTAVDASYYFGNGNPGLQIETAANGDESDSPPGPTIAVGSPVTWTYRVTNSGDAPLTNVLVTDDRGAFVVCPRTALQARETMSCTASGTAVEGQFKNVGTATATPPCGAQLSAQDASHYFGGGSAGIGLRKLTNGVDVNDPPGPTIPLGSPVTWSYVVTNTGQVALSGVGVTDNRGVSVICPQTTLNPGQSMTCTGTGTAQACQYDNLGIATGQTATGQKVNAVDPSYYFGSIQPGVSIETRVNGQDADSAPGPTIPVGSAVAWTYAVTNTGNVPLTGVQVSDSPGALVTCPKTSLGVGESMTCSASGIAIEGPFSNVGTVTAAPPCGSAVSAQDASHYTGGGSSALQLRKLVNGQDAVQPPGPTISVGSPVLWSYEVTNAGQVTLTGISVVDDQNVTVSCPKSILQVGETMTCTGRDTARACQYANLGRATGFTATGQQAAATDSSWYFGQARTSVGIETAVNGFAADSPLGPTVLPGSAVTWTYTVVNTGDVRLTGIQVSDNRGPQVVCPRTALDSGESMTCSATAAALEGAYENTGTVTATPPCGQPVSAQDSSHYTGGGTAALGLVKLLNGQDVAAPPGPALPLNQPITWTYRVTNTGQVALSGVSVTDSRGVTVSCPRATLQPGESMDCTGAGTVQACGYENVGLATGKTSSGQQVNAVDLSYYTGQIAPRIEIQTAVNGQDADIAPGPSITVGSMATLSYLVTNTGNVALTGVRVSEESGAIVTCPKTSLQPGEVMACFAMRAVTEGPSANRGLVTADPPCGAAVSSSDPTHYTGGGNTGLQLQKLINGQDAAWPGPSVPVGQPVVFTYTVTNTGQVSVNTLRVTDDDPSLVPDCGGKTTLQPGESATCTARGTTRACQYVNLARATAQSASGPVSAADSSFYNGTFEAKVQFETSVNGNDADTAPGVTLAAGSNARWTYRVTNSGQAELRNVRVSDDQGIVSCAQAVLAAGATLTCSVDSLVQEGAFGATGMVTADPPCGSTLSAQDPTYYFGERSGVQLQKFTNGQDGPTLTPGQAITWTYIVLNSGNTALSSVTVTDDRQVQVSCPKTALQPGESMTCTGTGTAGACRYENLGAVTATTSGGSTVTASDMSFYVVQNGAAIDIETAVNGSDADVDPGIPLSFGAPVQWTYVVTNTGGVALNGVAVSDFIDGSSTATPVQCPKTTLQPQESMTCTPGGGSAGEGHHSRVSRVTADTPCPGVTLSDQDESHYNTPVLQFLRLQPQPSSNFTFLWNDQGSGADLDGGFWRPNPPAGFFILGDYGQGNYNVPSQSVIVLGVQAYDDPLSPALRLPSGFDRIWDDSGSGADLDGSVWMPRVPAGYVCFGHIFKLGHDAPNPTAVFGQPGWTPGLDRYRCVRSDLIGTTRVPLGGLIWDDQGSGADDDVAVYRIPTLNIIFADDDYTRPVGLEFLLPRGCCPP